MRWSACLVVGVLLSGCTIGPPDFMPDAELRDGGLWTERDQEARELLDRYVGPGRPVRYASHARKFASVDVEPDGVHISAVETILGLRYDKRYYFIPEKGVYVF